MVETLERDCLKCKVSMYPSTLGVGTGYAILTYKCPKCGMIIEIKAFADRVGTQSRPQRLGTFVKQLQNWMSNSVEALNPTIQVYNQKTDTYDDVIGIEKYRKENNTLVLAVETKEISVSREPYAKPILCLEINAPEWFQRNDFCEWIKSKHTATWCDKEYVNEFSDAFILFDSEILPEEEMPMSIWSEICNLAEEHGMAHGVIWIKPV